MNTIDQVPRLYKLLVISEPMKLLVISEPMKMHLKKWKIRSIENNLGVYHIILDTLLLCTSCLHVRNLTLRVGQHALGWFFCFAVYKISLLFYIIVYIIMYLIDVVRSILNKLEILSSQSPLRTILVRDFWRERR